MSQLPILVINDPKEFVELIYTNKEDKLYLYLDDGFSLQPNIMDKIREIYSKFFPTVMFTDIVFNNSNRKNIQYYLDLDDPKDNKIIFSPIIIKGFPYKLKVYSELRYHSFSFLKQLQKYVLPWHIPFIGFEFDINEEKFSTISQEAKWVLQQETS